jgi:hypothetical protein
LNAPETCSSNALGTLWPASNSNPSPWRHRSVQRRVRAEV